jgi:tripartite-type tricarboxylate transporter receptor subunit TctC
MRAVTRRQILATAAAAPLLATRARAAGYPERPIQVVIPYTAGGVPESIMRLLAVSMEKRLGQKLIIEAKPGAGGNIGTQEVARAAPDGYTILVAATNNFVINQYVMRMSVDPLTALAPVARLADIPLVLFSNPAVPAKSLQDFLAYAKTSKVNYGVPGLGTVNHLLMERMRQTTHADMVLVPYRGSAPAALALIKNEIQIFPIGLAAVGGNL